MSTRDALVRNASRWILAIPHPNYATVSAQVQLVVNAVAAENVDFERHLAEANETIERLRKIHESLCAKCQSEGCLPPDTRCVCCCCGADLPEEPTDE